MSIDLKNKLSDDEISLQLIQLYLNGFTEDSIDFARSYYNSIKKDNIVFLVEEEVFVSMGYIVEKKAKLFGKTTTIPFLTALTTKNEYRGKGKLLSIIREAFDRLYKRGAPYVFLSPFHPTFYKKYGFADFSFFKKNIVAGGASYRLEKATEKHIGILLEIEEKNAKGFDNYLIKGYLDMKNLLSTLSLDGFICNIAYDKDIPVAFFISSKNRIEYYAQTQEDIIINLEQCKGMEFDDYRIDDEVLIQGRIICAKTAILSYNYNKSLSGKFKLTVRDSLIRENNFHITLNIERGKIISHSIINLMDLDSQKSEGNVIEIELLSAMIFCGKWIFHSQSKHFMDKY